MTIAKRSGRAAKTKPYRIGCAAMPVTIYKGAIVTCDNENRVYRYLVEKEGRIVFVGDRLPEVYQPLACTELHDRALLPAFGDTHLHFSSYAFFAATLDVRHARELGELRDRLRSYARSQRQRVILGFGFSPHKGEKRPLTRQWLDEALPERPVMIVKYDGHAGYINSAMLNTLPKSVQSLRGFMGEQGQLYQEAFFAATDHLTRSVSPLCLLRHMIGGADRLAEKGIGMLHTAEGVGFPWDMDVDLVRWFARGLKSPLQVRVMFQTMQTEKVVKRGLPRIGGCFATALDGCFGSEDAALRQPYAHRPSMQGVLYNADENVSAFVIQANRLGLQVQLHAIGDAAFDQAVSAFSKALADTPRDDHRHTIIHACLPTARGLETCARLGIAIAAQPIFLAWPEEPLEYLETLLGQRAYAISPYREMLRLGIRIAGGSDAPCTLPDPIAGMHAACNHYVPEQSVTIAQALRMFTADAAWMSFDEKQRGTLSVGKIADMAILSQNPLALAPAQLNQLRVEKLLLRGQPYQPRQRLPALVLNALKERKRPV